MAAATIQLGRAMPLRLIPSKRSVPPGPGLVEDVLFRLAIDDEPDLAAALVQLRDALGARGACFCEAEDGDPLIVASAGDLSDLPVAALREFLARGPSAPASGEISGVVVPSSSGRRCALVVWGGAPVGGPGTERLLRVILLLANRLHPRSPAGEAERPAKSEDALVFPEGYVPGHSPVMVELYAQMRAVIPGDVPVLLLGETGVGKEQLAHALHASSTHRGGPFVAVNCAAVPAELMEAEMFGIAKGVATGVIERPGKFQLANGGTLFLDEIGDMAPALQAKLLRALQGREIQPVGGAPVRLDVRVITATNSDIDAKIEQGQFRRDLYYRVAGYVLRVPPLRERREDIPELVQALLCVFAREGGGSTPAITAEALCALAAYAWPGNVRELEHELRRLANICRDGQTVDVRMLSERLLVSREVESNASPSSLRLDANIEHLERRLIRAALLRKGGKRSGAAKLLGISRNGLAMKMMRLGLGDSGVRVEL